MPQFVTVALLGSGGAMDCRSRIRTLTDQQYQMDGGQLEALPRKIQQLNARARSAPSSIFLNFISSSGTFSYTLRGGPLSFPPRTLAESDRIPIPDNVDCEALADMIAQVRILRIVGRPDAVRMVHLNILAANISLTREVQFREVCPVVQNYGGSLIPE